MSLMKAFMILVIIALSLNLAACETTSKSRSESGTRSYGVQGTIQRGGDFEGLPWDAYWAP
jgi:hypothetical protein